MRLSQEEKKKLYTPIINRFLSEEIITLQDLANEYDVSYASLCAYARKIGVKTRKSERRPRIKEETIVKVVDEYKTDSSTSIKSLSLKYGICAPTIARWLKKAGIVQRRASNPEYDTKIAQAARLYISTSLNSIEAAKEIGVGKHALRKYLKEHKLLKKTIECQKGIVFDKNYFEQINTEDRAYWFGFIFADGCVRYNSETNSGQLVIEINEKDIDMLEKFKQCLKSNIEIKHRQRIRSTGYITCVCSITLSSVKLCKDLMKFGCVPNKTYDGWIPKNMFANNTTLLSAFLRGYMDGDGYVSDYKNSVSSMSYVVHNYKVMNFLLKSIVRLSGVVPTVRYEYDDEGHGAYRLRITNSTDYHRFLECIYKNSTIHMERKYQRFLMHK